MAAAKTQFTFFGRNATTQNPLEGDFVEFANKTLEEWKVPGISIAVIDDQDVYSAVSMHSTGPLESRVIGQSSP